MKILLFVLLAISLTSCAYTRNRINDAKDIFTLCVNPSLGCQVQTGPIRTGVGVSISVYGMSDGYVGECGTGRREVPTIQYILIGPGGKESWNGNIVRERGKEYEQKQYFLVGLPKYSNSKAWMKPYYTQFEVDAGFLVGLRVGVNPGEILDFFLGFFGVDMYGDDICTDEDDHPPPKDKVLPPPWK